MINRTERQTTIKRNHLRYIRIATQKYTEARRKGRFRSDMGSDNVSDVTIRSFINDNSEYFLQLRRIIFYPQRITMAGLKSLNSTFYLLCVLAFIERVQISYLTNASEIYQKFFAIGI